MKTICIYEEVFGDSGVKFFVLDGDYSHLDRCYIGIHNDDSVRQAELLSLIFNLKNKLKVTMSQNFPLQLVRDEPDVKVITCGFCL